MTVHIAVTTEEYQKAVCEFRQAAREGLECLEAPSEEKALAEFIQENHIAHVIVGVRKYEGRLYDSLPAGATVARFGIGYDGINLPRATASGIRVTNTPGCLDTSVAELTLGFLFCIARNLPALHVDMMQGNWHPVRGIELRGKKLSILGCGNIGCAVAALASRGLGMKVTGLIHRPGNESDLQKKYGFSQLTPDFATAVSGADFVSLHLPGKPELLHYIDERKLRMIPDQAWFINTARGLLVDERALYKALSNGKLSGAALDVFEEEPYVPKQPDCDLRKLPHVLLSPHVGSHTRESCSLMAARALANIRSSLSRDFAAMDLLNP